MLSFLETWSKESINTLITVVLIITAISIILTFVSAQNDWIIIHYICRVLNWVGGIFAVMLIMAAMMGAGV